MLKFLLGPAVEKRPEYVDAFQTAAYFAWTIGVATSLAGLAVFILCRPPTYWLGGVMLADGFVLFLLGNAAMSALDWLDSRNRQQGKLSVLEKEGDIDIRSESV